MSIMTIKVQTNIVFSEYEQFDPLEIPEVELFHMECGGGAVSFIAEGPTSFRCTACKDRGDLIYNEGALVRIALRRLLIYRENQEVDLGTGQKIRFIV